MPALPQYPASLTEAAARAAAEASRQWARAATLPGRRRGRIVTAATLAWDAAYPIAYAHGYTALATRAAATFQELANGPATDRAQRDAVRQLVQTAHAARPRHNAAPPPPRRVLEVAAIAALNRHDGQSAPQAITEAVHRKAVTEGALHGALTAAGDITTTWRTRTPGPVMATPLGEVTLAEQVNTSFAALNRDLVSEWSSRADQPRLTQAALAHTSFAIPATTSIPSAATPPTALAIEATVPARGRSRS
ncbi:hypothetical protein WEI85_07640 [Actinomycetes bacterium KLBMP 9797]